VDADAWAHLYVVVLGGSTEWLAKRMATIDGALVFERT
jgi:hypothetical protein